MRALFDKTNLASCINDYYYFSNQKQNCNKIKSLQHCHFQDLINALILYDEIEYLPNSNGGFFYDYRFPFNEDIDFLKKLPITKIDIDMNYVIESLELVRERFPEIAEFERKYPFGASSYYREFRYQFGALEYVFISNYNGSTYFPSKERLEFLNEFLNFDKHSSKPGEDLINYLDKSVAEFYKELNEKIGKPYIKFSIPLLLDYIYNVSKGSDGIIETCLQIRETKEIKDFRSWINSINLSVKKGNWVEYNSCFNLVDDIVNDILKLDKMFKAECEVTLSWPPSVTYPLNKKFIKSENDKVGSVFIRTLANYGLNERKKF